MLYPDRFTRRCYLPDESTQPDTLRHVNPNNNHDNNALYATANALCAGNRHTCCNHASHNHNTAQPIAAISGGFANACCYAVRSSYRSSNTSCRNDPCHISTDPNACSLSGSDFFSF